MKRSSLGIRSIVLAASHRTAFALGLALGAVLASPVRSGEVVVKPVTFPSAFLAEGLASCPSAIDRSLEASAVAPVDDGRTVLVAHDKLVPLRLVETATGRPIGSPLTSPAFPSETPKSSKWEALARDSSGTFYAAGSHSGKTDDERAQHAKLIRFRLDGAETPAVDAASVASWRLDAPLVRSLQSLGLPNSAVDQRKIEGLAIRESEGPSGPRRELVIGLRQPDDLVRAFVADLTSTPSDGAELPLSLLFAFEPGEREGVRSQLTSLEHLPAWKGFLAITATEDEQNVFHGNTLWFLADDRIAEARGATLQAEKLWVFEPAMKAEGLCTLPNPPTAEAGAVRLLIVFDNDAHVTHIPSRFQVVDLARRSHGFGTTPPRPSPHAAAGLDRGR